MKKVAVFGNAGGGKSTLSKRLATMTNLPLYVLDKIQYLTPKYRDYVQQAQKTKGVYHLKSTQEITQFFQLIDVELKS